MSSPYHLRSSSEIGIGLEPDKDFSDAPRRSLFDYQSKEDRDSQRTTEMHSKYSRASKNSDRYSNNHYEGKPIKEKFLDLSHLPKSGFKSLREECAEDKSEALSDFKRFLDRS